MSKVDLLADEAKFEAILGVWQNELGSQLVIDSVAKDGRLVGDYRSSSGVDGRVFKMNGWINQHEDSPVLAISFTVPWGDYGSITSWTGFLDKDDEGQHYIKVLWHLIRPQNNEPWERIISNSSEFRKTKS